MQSACQRDKVFSSVTERVGGLAKEQLMTYFGKTNLQIFT